jgi:hypothetical protein
MRGLTSRITQRDEVPKTRRPKDPKSQSSKLSKSRSNETLPHHFGPIILWENFMPHSPKLLKLEVSKNVAHSSVMTHGTHSRSFGCVIHSYPRDMCHPSFHDTLVDVTSYDIMPPRHSETIPLRDISKHDIHKLSKLEHPKSRSESGPFINKDTWRQIIHFGDFPLG